MRTITALLSAIVGLTLAGVAIGAKEQTTVDPKRVEPISLVDDGFTKTVEFYLQETTYQTVSNWAGVPGQLFSVQGERYFDPDGNPASFPESGALEVMNFGRTTNWLGTFDITGRARLGVVVAATGSPNLQPACPSPGLWFSWRGGYSIQNEEGAITFKTVGTDDPEFPDQPGYHPGTPGLHHVCVADFPRETWTYEGTGQGIYSCLTSATLSFDLSDNVPQPVVGHDQFFTSGFSSPLSPIPEANKLIVTLEGPSDCF